MLEDVHDSVNSLVGVMQTYKTKGKMSKLFMSSLFKRRQEEAEAVINNAISSLQVGLEIVRVYCAALSSYSASR